MARITIEISDAIQTSVVTKIKEIGSAANISQVAVEQLNKSLKDVNAKGFDKAVNSIDRLSKAQINLIKSQEQLAQAYSNTAIRQTKANSEDEKYKRQIEIGNLELQRRKAILEATSKIQSVKQAQAQINLATQAEKNAIAINRQNVALETASEKLRILKLRKDQLESSTSKLSIAWFSLNNIARAFALIKSAERIVQLVDSYTLMENRLRLVSSSQENLNSLQRDMFKTANETRVPVVELTQSFVRFDYALKSLGATQRESLRFTKTLSQTLAISGLTTQEQSSALLQLSQALNKGKLDGDEFRTVMETLPTVATAIAKTMGVARGELIKLAPQGKITSAIIREAMASIADETDRAFKDLTPTIGQAFTVLQNKVIENIGIFNQATGASEILAKTILVLAENIGTLTLAATLSASIFAGRFIPTIVAGIARIGAASLALLANPIFLIPAAITAAFVLIKSVLDRRNALIDAQTDRDNARADAFEKQQERRRRSLIYETEATIKLKTEYGKYLVLLAETKDAEKKGFISERAKEALLLETVVGKGREKAQGLIDKKPKSLLLDAEILANERKDVKAEYDKSLVELETFINASLALRREQTRPKKEGGNPEQIARDALKLAEDTLIAKKAQLESLEKNQIEDSIFSNRSQPIADLKEQIKQLEILRAERENVYNTEFQTSILTIDNIKIDTELQKNLINVLKERLDILARIAVETIKVDVINTRNRMQQEYNDTLAATNELVFEGNINEAQKQILLSNTSKIRELTRTNEKADAFAYKTESQKRLEAINKETIETLRLVDANIKLYESYFDYGNEVDKVTEGSTRQKKELKKELDKSSLVASGGSINNVRVEEIDRENQRYADYQKSIESMKADELKSAGENESKKESIKAEYMARELKAKSEHQNKLDAIDNDAASKKLALTANMFGLLSDLAGVFAEDGKKGAKEMFYISQGLALAQATVSTASSIASGLATPPSPNYGAAIAAGIAGATQIAAITTATIKGFAQGKVNIGGTGTSTSDSMLAYIGRGESVINSRSTARHKNILEAINADNGTSTSNINNTYLNNGGGGGNAPTINIINNTGGKIGENTKYNPETNTLDLQLDYIDAKMAQRYADGNGKLAKAIDGKRVRGY